jgi:hypothetical protein
MKIIHSLVGASCLTFILGAGNLHAQNVGIGFSNPLSKLTVNGNFAVGAGYNVAAPTDGAIIQGTVGIGTSSPKTNSMLHIYNAGLAQEILESGGGTTGAVPYLGLINDSSTNFRSFIVMGNPAGTRGFQLVTDQNSNGTNSFGLFDVAASATRIFVNPNGYVGISNASPLAPLHVGVAASIVDSTTRSFFSPGSTALVPGTVTSEANAASAIFANTIWVQGSVVAYSGTITSDARLKNIAGRSDSAKDFDTLMKIEVTDYTMKDVVKFGNKPFKKVIAQQVEKIYPSAVTTGGIKGLTFTPDVYAIAESVKMEKSDVYLITLSKGHDFKDGDSIRLITPKNLEVNAVAHVVDDKSFTVETKEPIGDKVFVYGKQCTDLKAVDYDAISMLNVSATQELAKKVEALEQENSDLHDQAKRLSAIERQEKATIAQRESEIAALKAANEKVTAMASEMAALKKAMAVMQEKENGLQKATLEQ